MRTDAELDWDVSYQEWLDERIERGRRLITEHDVRDMAVDGIPIGAAQMDDIRAYLRSRPEHIEQMFIERVEIWLDTLEEQNNDDRNPPFRKIA